MPLWHDITCDLFSYVTELTVVKLWDVVWKIVCHHFSSKVSENHLHPRRMNGKKERKRESYRSLFSLSSFFIIMISD